MSSEELQEELKRVKRENKAFSEANLVLLEELEKSQVHRWPMIHYDS